MKDQTGNIGMIHDLVYKFKGSSVDNCYVPVTVVHEIQGHFQGLSQSANRIWKLGLLVTFSSYLETRHVCRIKVKFCINFVWRVFGVLSVAWNLFTSVFIAFSQFPPDFKSELVWGCFECGLDSTSAWENRNRCPVDFYKVVLNTRNFKKLLR